MIRTIIFDIGNVLTQFGWREFIHSFGYEKEVEERIGKATVDNPFWREFDRGAKIVFLICWKIPGHPASGRR